MRSGGRRRSGGKRTNVLDLIDHYWSEINGDFARYLNGTDAFDWVRGLRPWSQFKDYCDTIAQIDGSRLQAAQLNDERFAAEIERLLHEKQQNDRPPLEGDTAEVKALRQLSNDIRLLLRHQGLHLPFLEGPEGPADRIRARKRAIGRARIAELRGTDM